MKLNKIIRQWSHQSFNLKCTSYSLVSWLNVRAICPAWSTCPYLTIILSYLFFLFVFCLTNELKIIQLNDFIYLKFTSHSRLNNLKKKTTNYTVVELRATLYSVFIYM